MRSLWALVLVAALSACVTDGKTDSGGRPMSLENKGVAKPWESRFTTFLMLDPSPGYTLLRQQRDNGIGWNETISWKGGFLEIQHIATSWFGPGTSEAITSGELLEQLVPKTADVSIWPMLEESNPVLVGRYQLQGRCVVLGFGKRLKKFTGYDNDQGGIDTVVRGAYCNGVNVAPEEFMRRLALSTDQQNASVEERFRSVSEQVQSVSRRDEWDVRLDWAGVVDGGQATAVTGPGDVLLLDIQGGVQPDQCAGTFRRDGIDAKSGSWSVGCGLDMTASGEWRFGQTDRDFEGTGTDRLGRAIRLTGVVKGR